MANTPYLFQFRKIDNHLFHTLINRTLWFSSPRVFNDPFDCQLPVQTDNSIEEITKYLLQVNNSKKHYPTRKDVLYRAKELEKNPRDFQIFLKNKFFNQRRFSCFVHDETLIYNNSSMWGNYADKSRGVCMKFQFAEEFEESFELDNSLNISPLWIAYEKGIPTFNYIRYKLQIKQDFNSANQYFIGTKSEEWIDESEVRIILEKTIGEFENEYVGVKFKPEYFKEIIIGCLSSKEDKNTINQIIKRNSEYSHVKFTELKKSDTRFGFEPK